MPTKLISFEKFTGRRVPVAALRNLSAWSNQTPGLGEEQRNEFQDLSRLEEAQRRLRELPVSLLVGAGTTMAAGGPSWYGLIGRLWLNELRGRYDYPALNDKQAIDEVGTVFGDSVLVQARMLRQISGPGFMDKVREATYRGLRWDAAAPRQVAALAARLQSQERLHQLITFNYDELTEHALHQQDVQAHPVFHGAREWNRGIPVRHVHGYLPPPPTVITPAQKDSVVFDEETYHSRFNQPGHWTNRIMLSALTESCCVFVGFSMNDPNVRRLLEQSRTLGEIPHFVLLRQPPLEGEPDQQLARARLIHAQEDILRELGLNVIWYSGYDDLPILLELLTPERKST
ncbi:SIR2 family protein [Deinococcus rubellus]|uniref:SIR2 family protein n=1 Tax=Deinococcus rubellus TaxID=1889240 RepID=A0ABY5YKQ3_9DEIO|nr:SIR2 family protein [Deinococcus rubellus]UWX64716.1 SIR2 family protein [Deinococcus rubellus]